MAGESIEAKAVRLLAEQRVHVTRVEGATVEATVHGDHGRYEAGFDSVRGWYCSCPALGACSHLRAVILVTTPRRHA
jgi:uncharacterized Zn finger protein